MPGVHHVMSRGNRHQAIFADDRDRIRFLTEFELAVLRQGWSSLGYCLMDNHFHLIVETTEANLGMGMRAFLSRFAQLSNKRHGTDGHMFNGRYRSRRVDSDEYFACLVRYVALNPVNAGLCSDPLEWRWSSHRSFTSGMDTPLAAVSRVEELLECWGCSRGLRYMQLVAPDSVFGSWADATQPTPPRPTISELLARLPLDAAMTAARWQYGYRVGEIAKALGMSHSTVSRRTRM